MPENELTRPHHAQVLRDPKAFSVYSVYRTACHIIVSSLDAGNLCSYDSISLQVYGGKQKERQRETKIKKRSERLYSTVHNVAHL